MTIFAGTGVENEGRFRSPVLEGPALSTPLDINNLVYDSLRKTMYITASHSIFKISNGNNVDRDSIGNINCCKQGN